MLKKRQATFGIANSKTANIAKLSANATRTSLISLDTTSSTSSVLPILSAASIISCSSSKICPIDNRSSAALLLSTNSTELPNTTKLNCSTKGPSDCIRKTTTNAIPVRGGSLHASATLQRPIEITQTKANIPNHPVKKFGRKNCRQTVNPMIKNRYVDYINRFPEARYFSTTSKVFTNRNKTLHKHTLTMLDHIYYLSALILALCVIITRPLQVDADVALVSSAQRLRIPESIGISSSTKLVRVELNGNVVKPGDPIPAKNFKNLDMNKISWDMTSIDALYTLALLDLDRKPSAGNGTSVYNQYTSFNIPGNSIINGQSIVAFEPPNVPCQPSTKHRLVMLLFHQRESIDIPDVAYMSAHAGQSQKRENFRIDNFMRQHRLDLVGANVFQAIGESNGICSGSSTIHNFNNMTHLIVAMVTAIVAFSLMNNKRQF